MALLCAAMKRDSVSLSRFPLLSHIHVFSWDMLLVSRLKRPYLFFLAFFFSRYCFLLVFVLSVLFLVAVISPPCFSTKFSSRFIDASTLFSILVSHLPPSFLDTYSLSTSSLGCNALWIVISFLVLWTIYLSSSQVHFKNSPEYLTRSTAYVFIPLIRFPRHSFVSSSFLVLQRYSFLIFFFISTCLIVSASKIPKYLLVSFSPCVRFFSWFGSPIPLVRCSLQLFITRMTHFPLSNSIPMSW